MLSTTHIIIPSGEEPGTRQPHAVTHLIRVNERRSEPVAVVWQQVRMTRRDVRLAALTQFYFSLQVWARKLLHSCLRPAAGGAPEDRERAAYASLLRNSTVLPSGSSTQI